MMFGGKMQKKYEWNEELFHFVRDKLENGATFREVQNWLMSHRQYSVQQFFCVLTLMKHGTLTKELFVSEIVEFRKGFELQIHTENQDKKSILYSTIKQALNINEPFTASDVEEFKKLPKNQLGQTWSPTFKFAGVVQDDVNFNEALLAFEDFLQNHKEKLNLS